MMRVRLICFLLFLAATPVSAQTVVVRSGEHATFTRLVMKIGEGADWSVSNQGREVRVNVDQPDIRFDLGGVFKKIPRTRLRQVAQRERGGPLELSLNCNCAVEGFLQAENYLVIDIRDSTGTEFYLKPRLQPVDLAAYRFQLGTGGATTDGRPAVKHRKEAQGGPPVEAPSGAGKSGKVISQTLSEQRLLAQIERAASQGLLTPVTRFADEETEIGLPPSEPVIAPAKAEINIASTTVIDRDLSAIASTLDELSGEPTCLPDSVVAVPDWADERPFADQIGELRASLFGEFDQLDAEIALDLARTYIHFGFGAEAERVLTLVPDPSPELDALQALTRIVDGSAIEGANPFLGQSGCAQDFALWSTLADPEKIDMSQSDALLRAFANLPRHLRHQLGPRLSRSLNKLEHNELAAAVLRDIDRSSGSTGPSHDLAEAEVESATGKTEIVVEKIEKVVASDSDVSPEALIKLIDMHYLEKKALRPDVPELAASYATEHRQGKWGSELRRVHAMSLALAGRFEAAFEALDVSAELDGPALAAAASGPVLELLAQNADDVTFLTFALPLAEPSDRKLPASLAANLSERLLALGFPQQAQAIIKKATPRGMSREDRLLRANIALANGLPHRAMIEVLNLTDPEASAIRARAMQANGDYEMAGQVLLDAESPENAARNLWLGDAWDELPLADDPRYLRLAELSTRLAKESEKNDETAPLAGARSLLDDSVGARSEIAEILSELDVAEPNE